MKVDFIRTGIPVKNASVQQNFVSNIQRENVNLKSQPDVFVKSQPVFKGTLPEIRRDVIREGADGITSCLAIYANVYGYAAGHIMPTQQDFDNCMSSFFPLFCCASSSYAFPDGTVRYPNSDEFVEILQKLWNESKGENGADESKYRTPKNAMMDENHRLRQIKRFVIDDMARAMNAYSKHVYDYPLENLEDVKNLALTIYDDETVRTINKKVSAKTNKKLLKGKESKYVRELSRQPDSASMLDYLFKHEDKFFSPPQSLRSRYEHGYQPWSAVAEAMESIFAFSSDRYRDDELTPLEIGMDIDNGWYGWF